jgi:hypothetical protein
MAGAIKAGAHIFHHVREKVVIVLAHQRPTARRTIHPWHCESTNYYFTKHKKKSIFVFFLIYVKNI